MAGLHPLLIRLLEQFNPKWFPIDAVVFGC
ncbi:hypothetical protein SAMN05444166_1594 [Singulisphaera sp. GP187]|nr:hypothetical protein SAMN05444166_1594 [Singulisphaera sp. GP187]